MKSTTLAAAFAAFWTLACSEAGEMGGFSTRELRRHVEYLASDELEGRETGKAGIAKAEEYIAGAFREAGLEPLPGHDDFYLPFSLYRRAFDHASTTIEVSAGDTTLRGEAGVDFRVFPFSDQGRHETEVVFAGYGITAPEHGYDDYEGLDVKGKLVFMLRHEPRERDPYSSFDGTAFSNHALFATKASNARAHGAAGMILVTDALHTGPDDLRLGTDLRLRPFDDSSPSGLDASGFVAVHVSQSLGEALARSSGSTLAELQRAVDDGTKPAQLSLGGARARVDVTLLGGPQEITARNVAGFLEGSDSKRRDEWIVVGAHHDHEGSFSADGDSIFNGADDNASGTSGILALARELAARPEPPARSIVFMTFTAEEKGLLGSRVAARGGVLSPGRVIFMLNLDMIGRNPGRSLRVIGDGYVEGLREIVEAANASVDLTLGFAGNAYSGNSDHDPFYRQGVPFAFLTTGGHGDYHQVSDHAEKIAYGRMVKILRLVAGVVERVAEAPAPFDALQLGQ